MQGAPVALPAGRVGRPHGLDGSFYVSGARSRLLSAGTVVALAGRERAIVRRAGTDQRPIVRLEGVEDRAAAQELRGLELTVRAPQAPVLGEGEWWAHELEGCEVFDGSRRVGTVTRLIELPSCEALEVGSGEGTEPLLVPMVKDAIRSVEVARRRIEVDLDFLGLEQPTNVKPPRAGRRRGG
ncbi:MAG: 16S rRNA processing protein RimM [Actinobacteria bacterium]|nr:MAG: 16S rRNA processing protein RimM [Actinomycetota bacterium]